MLKTFHSESHLFSVSMDIKLNLKLKLLTDPELARGIHVTSYEYQFFNK